MDNLKEQEIDQILRHEIAKLKTAITYIEEAKTLANESSVKFSEMSVKYDSLTNFKLEIENRLVKIEELSEKSLVSATDTYQSKLIEEFNKLAKTNLQTSKLLNAEISNLKRNARSLNLLLILSLIAAVTAIIISVLL